MAKKLGRNQGKWAWKRAGAYRVLSLMKEAKSISEIAKEVDWKEETVWNFVSSPTFLRKFNTYLKSVYFEFQKNKILALEELSRFFFEIIMGRKKVEGITPDKASGHFIKLLKIQQEPKISNPINIISNISESSEPKGQEDLAKEFGFDRLQIEDGEGPTACPEPQAKLENIG